MAQQIPNNFLFTSEAQIASYNFTDIAEGTGIVLFYGFPHIEDATTSYALSQNALYPTQFKTTNNYTDTSFTKITDIDFDTVFNLPKRIKGLARSTFSFGADSTGSADTIGETYCVIRIRKVSNNVESEVANAQSETISVPNNSETYITTNLEINISSITHYKKGDTLRVTVEVWGKRTGANPRAISFFHDPTETNATTDQDAFKIYIPFALDL